MERGTGEKLTSFKLNQSKGLKYNTNHKTSQEQKWKVMA